MAFFRALKGGDPHEEVVMKPDASIFLDMKGWMNMTNFLSGKKKILTMILGIVSGLAMIFGLEQTEVNVISGAIVAVGSVISYLMVEGKIDVERLRTAALAVNEVFDYIGEAEPAEKHIDNTTAPAEEEHAPEYYDPAFGEWRDTV
jgi:phage shock protein PspC (stress-responsive transcriptional regulator)